MPAPADPAPQALDALSPAPRDLLRDRANGPYTPHHFAWLFSQIYAQLVGTAGFELPTTGHLDQGPQAQEAIFEALDRLHEELDRPDAVVQEMGDISIEAASAAMSLTAGAILWVMRTGSLAASLLSVMPVWSQIDPLPVLSAGKSLLDSDFDLEEADATGLGQKAEELVAGAHDAQGGSPR